MYKQLDKEGQRALLSPIRWIIITGIVYFISAGRMDISFVWFYILIYATGGILGGLYVAVRNPAIMNERGRIKKGSKNWDVVLVLSYFFLAIVAVPLLAGLDMRKDWSIMPPIAFYAGIGLYVISLYFAFKPMLDNPFFETNVRIQTDKGQYVADTGLYAVIRHPGYLGMIIGSFGLCLALRSLVAFIPGILMVVIVVVRTHLEDKTLKEELPGYEEYAKKVRYRLIPFIW